MRYPRTQPLPLLTCEAALRYEHPMTEEDFEWLFVMLRKLKPRMVARTVPDSTRPTSDWADVNVAAPQP